jgi:hypothetical protein
MEAGRLFAVMGFSFVGSDPSTYKSSLLIHKLKGLSVGIEMVASRFLGIKIDENDAIVSESRLNQPGLQAQALI